MPWGYAAAAVAGALVSNYGARGAADTQAEATRDAAGLQDRQYWQTREDMAPWREAGVGALGQLTEGSAVGGDFNRDFTLADFNRDPGYEFRQREGQRGLERSAAARGGVLSGSALRGVTRYNQDFASNEYQNAYNRFNNDRTQRFNRLASIAGIGQTATRDVASQGQQNANVQSDLLLQGANARAAGQVGSANAINSGLSSLGNWYQYQQMQRNNSNSGGNTNWAGNSGWGTGNGYGNQDIGEYI